MKRPLFKSLVTLALAVAVSSTAWAQEPVRRLQDLVGVKGSSAEREMESRGFTFVRTEKSGDSAYSYWRDGRSNRCVAVRTADGAYQSIVFTPDSDCEGGSATQLPAAAPDGEGSFDTVCGVETGGKTYRYRCHVKVDGCKGEGHCRTQVTMPDNEYTISSGKGDEIEVTFSGMNPMKSTSSFKDGQTRFSLEGKVYFLYRSPDRAKRELANLH